METQVFEWDFDQLTTAQIKDMIAKKIVKASDVVAFYGNEWWDQNQEEDT